MIEGKMVQKKPENVCVGCVTIQAVAVERRKKGGEG